MLMQKEFEEMLDRIIEGIKSPKRIIFRYKEKLLGAVKEESLIDECIRYFPSGDSRIKILFVAPKYDYGDKSRGLSYEENNFLHCMIHSGYEVVAFDPILAREYYGKKKMNRILVEAAYRWVPDIMFSVLFKDEIEINSLIEIRDNMGVTILNWFCDDHWRFDKFSKYYAPYLSWIITTYKDAVDRYREIGCRNIVFSQWGCNHFLYKKIPLPYEYDVTFMGQPHGNRENVIKKIRKAGFNVETFGYGWPNGRVNTYEMIKIFNQSKINLNLSNASRGTINQIKGRDFEIPGCGGFMLSAYSEELKEYFSLNREIVTYCGIDDMIKKIDYYLKHEDERESIRESGYIRVLKEHTYSLRLENIFNIVRGNKEI